MSSSEKSKMLSILSKVVSNNQDGKHKPPVIEFDGEENTPRPNLEKFKKKNRQAPEEKKSQLEKKIETKQNLKKIKNENSVPQQDSSVPEAPTEGANKKQKNKKKKNNKTNEKKPAGSTPQQYSSNWEKFLKKQQNESVEAPVHKKVKKSPNDVKLTPQCPIKDSYAGLTPYVALDCEMVRVEGNEQALARCSIVNYNGHTLFDKYIRPKKKITDYLTKVSGITSAKLRTAQTLDAHKEEILGILRGRIIVGHTLKSDFEVLKFYPDEKNLRDMVGYKPLRDNGKIVGLKKLVEHHLKYRIQAGEHDSVEDARAAMALYRMFEKDWENELKKEERERKKLESLSKTTADIPEVKNKSEN